MKPETEGYLRKAHSFVDQAAGMQVRWPDEAGRAAYFAGFHAAQPWIVEHESSASKTHSGVQTQFA